MATGGKGRQSREQRERTRAYQIRQEIHRRQGRRRNRDNVLALIIGIVVIAGAVAMQTVYFVGGPGAPAPIPSATDTPAPTPESIDPLLPAPETSPTP